MMDARAWRYGTTLPANLLTEAERDARDSILPEAVLQAIKYFLAPIANDLVHPDVAVDCYKQGAFVQAGWPGVRRNPGINQMIPDTGDLGLCLSAVDAQLGKDFRHHVRDGLCGGTKEFLLRREIDTAPLREDTLFGVQLRRAERRFRSKGRT